MKLKAQLSGYYKENAFSGLEEKLQQYGVTSTHPHSDGFIFTQNAGAPGLVSALWTPYESNLDFYESTIASDVYIVDNANGLVTEAMARGMLFAMLNHKPILLLKRPTFCSHVGAFMRHTVMKHLDQCIILDVLRGNEEVVRERLASIPTSVDYSLTQSDATLVRAIIRRHFRELLHSGKAHENSSSSDFALATAA